MSTRLDRTRSLGVVFVGLSLILGCSQEEPPSSPQDAAPRSAAPSPSESPSDTANDGAESAVTNAAGSAADPAVTPATAAPPTTTSEDPSDAPQHVILSPVLPDGVVDAGYTEPDPLEQVQQTLLVQWAEIQSVKAKIDMTLDQQETLKQKRKGEGEYEVLKQDGKEYIRIQLRQGIVAEVPDSDSIMTGERNTAVFDGDYVYYMWEQHNEKRVFKTFRKNRVLQPIGGEFLLGQIFSYDDLTLDTEAVEDGKSMYLFRCSSQQGQITTDFYIDQATGVLHKLHSKDKRQKSDHVFSISDVVFDDPPARERFEFTPPEGVEVRDRTVPRDATPPANAAAQPEGTP